VTPEEMGQLIEPFYDVATPTQRSGLPVSGGLRLGRHISVIEEETNVRVYVCLDISCEEFELVLAQLLLKYGHPASSRLYKFWYIR
jgi:hypothetical protein